MADKSNNSSNRATARNRTVYSEFGNSSNSEAFDRAVPHLPPNQQNVRVQATRAGRKGKTVTVITGFQTSPDTLNALLKQLKNQCGAGGTAKENEIEIQGDHKQKILEILLQQGYKAKISGG
ncbi:MAG: translation initiation factor [Cyanobacteria bacterium RM1_2_2]|nr:translation initiation factor [Cyanobacteria bacterium RM1_2_2]